MGVLVLSVMLVVAGVVTSFALRRSSNTAARSAAPAPLVIGVGLGVVALALSMVKTIPAGHVGVVTLFGKVQDTLLTEGLHFANPLVDVEVMSVQVMKDESKYDAATQDMQNVHVSMVMNFRLLPDSARTVYQTIGISYVQKVVHPASQEILKAETAKHKASEILHQRQQIKNDVQKTIAVWLLKYGIELKEISISNVTFDPEYARAIEQKQIQEQRAAQKEYELQQAQREAEIAAARAKGEADAMRESAKGKADAMRLEGEAQSEYNKKVSQSLTETLIQSEYLKRWDGKLPMYMLGSNAMPMIPLPGK